MKILFGEDDLRLQKQIKNLLLKAGYEVECCSSCEQVYEKLDGGIDLLLLDVHLADGCVYEVTDTIRKDYPIPTVYLSGDLEETTILRGYHLDCCDYIEKPVRPAILLARIEAAARHSGLLKAVYESNGWIYDQKEQKLRQKEDSMVLAGAAASEIYFRDSLARLFLLLFRNCGQLIGSEQLKGCISHECSDASLRVRLVELRALLPEEFTIENVRGHGYRLLIRKESIGNG